MKPKEHVSVIVLDRFCKEENSLICINGKITVSQSQRFLTTQGFKKAAELKQGDMLMSLNGPQAVITIDYLHV